jgi:hypothetical protein
VEYAASILVDSFLGGYYMSTLQSYQFGVSEGLVGAPLVGAGLEQALEKFPPFSIERITAAVQMQFYSGHGAIDGWEILSRMRYLNMPCESYIIPNAEPYNHGIQNPRQCFASIERALDWWRFWLKGEEDVTSAKESQYLQWRRLREHRQKRPRPPLLDWSAKPR